jgi:hypothetical protein
MPVVIPPQRRGEIGYRYIAAENEIEKLRRASASHVVAEKLDVSPMGRLNAIARSVSLEGLLNQRHGHFVQIIGLKHPCRARSNIARSTSVTIIDGWMGIGDLTAQSIFIVYGSSPDAHPADQTNARRRSRPARARMSGRTLVHRASNTALSRKKREIVMWQHSSSACHSASSLAR